MSDLRDDTAHCRSLQHHPLYPRVDVHVTCSPPSHTSSLSPEVGCERLLSKAMSVVEPSAVLVQAEPKRPPQLSSPSGQALLTRLLGFPLCASCTLRYCNVRDTDVYARAPLTTLSSWLTSTLPGWTPPPLCFACLNILPSLSANVRAFLTSPTYASYSFTTFALTVSLPITATLRHLSLTACLTHPSPSPTSPPPALPCLDLKEAVKAIVLFHISTLTPAPALLPSSPPADLSLNLSFTFPSIPAESSLISSHTASTPHFRSRKRRKGEPDDVFLTQVNVLQVLPSVSRPELLALYTAYDHTGKAGARDEVERGVKGEVGVSACGFEWALVRPPVLLMGSYIKHSRGISQSPWCIDSEDDPPPPPLPSSPPSSPSPLPPALPSPSPPATRVRITSTSVQEELSLHILPAFSASSARFSSSGREDLDVRMLGDGRPFVLEMMGVRRLLDEGQMAALEALVNLKEDEEGEKLVEVRGLRLVGKEEFAAMKAGVESKRKRYRCVVWVARPVTGEEVRRLCEVRELRVQQNTPIRVLHRRTALVRPKLVHELQVERMAPHWLRVDLITSAGAYVKEWVHGDRGRTQPSLSSLLQCQCECVQLDVLQLLHEQEEGGRG